MRLRSYLVYGLLAICWIGIAAWQLLEHNRVRQAVRQGQFNHAHDIANSLAVVIRSQRRFGVVTRDRLVDALEDLARSRELLGIALLSPAGEIVAAGGQALPGGLADLPPGTAREDHGRLLVASVVELGPERMPTHRGPPRNDQDWTPASAEKVSSAVVWNPEELRDKPPEDGTARPLTEEEERAHRRARWERMRQNHPFWQSPERYRELYEKQGLHMMVLMLDNAPAAAARNSDYLVRLALCALALVAALGFGLAWRTVTRTTQLQVRLAQARAMNNYLRELNLAAAGLAHETRNPLNVVRGLAQVVARDTATPPPAREHLDTVVEEVDRITARLNEFIDYSKPREPRLAAVKPGDLARDVARTLESDLQDKRIEFSFEGPDVDIQADSTMLRQVLFNLLLNAAQAVGDGGRIAVRFNRHDRGFVLDVVDDGPGIPEEVRLDIFRPYYTLSDHGTGLGLAIVRQIVLAHGWDIACIAPAEGQGACFHITGLAPGNEPPPTTA